MTVRHLHRLHKPRDPIDDAQRFQAGFGRCAAEACQFLLSLPGIDTHVGQNLVRHLGACASSVAPLSVQVPSHPRSGFSPPLSPLTPSTAREPNCEALSSTPSVQDLSRPIAGLLMQVPPKNSPSNARGVLRNVILERQSKAANFKRIQEQNRKIFQQDVDMESDVEIDIEKIDNRDMWRPW